MSELKKIEVVDNEYSASFLRELSELRKNKRFCDIKLCVGDQQIDCHKCVLSSASPHFKDLFDDASLDSGKDVIDLTDKTNLSVLEAIIDYMYSGSISFALVEEAAVLLKTLDYFKMKPMKEKCETFLMDNINEENFLAMLGVSDELYHAKLLDASVHCIVENFKKIYCSNDFKKLNKNQLESVLKKIGGSNTETTYLTYQAIVGWLKHDTQNRKDYLEELLDYVSVESLSLSHSREIILNDNFLKNDPGGCKWLVRTFLSSNSSLLKKSSPTLFILSVGDTKSCYKFDIYDKLLTTLETRPPFCAWAIAKYKHSIYAFEKAINPECETIGLKYNTIENSWTQFGTNSRALTKPVPINSTGMCAKDEKLFLVGGWGNNVIKNPFVSYNLETNVWTSLLDPNFTRPYPAICSYNSSIYVLGQTNNFEKCIERYDDREGKWFTEWEDFKLPFGSYSSIVISECIYSLNREKGQLFKFEPRSSKFDVDNLKSFPTDSWGGRGHLASINGIIYVASKDGISEYNFHLNEWDEILKTSFVFPVLLS